ncbi:radical SAM-associated putative lipoprotein [Bacteroidota bacterium]
MKNSLLGIVNKLILVFLAISGFSCDPDDNGTIYYEYGSPSADFKATGTIVDESTLQKLSNIEIVMDYDTVYSDANGNYEVIVRNSPLLQTYNVSFKDVDGDLNGTYFPNDTIVDFSDVEFINGEGMWYHGEKSKEINIKLSPDETI